MFETEKIKIYDFNIPIQKYNINNENNKIFIIHNNNIIKKQIEPNNYDTCDLLKILNETLEEFTFTWNTDWVVKNNKQEQINKIEIRYVDLLKFDNEPDNISNNNETIFTIKNNKNSIFRVLGFTQDIYENNNIYISEQEPYIPDKQPLSLLVNINNNKSYLFPIMKNNKMINICNKTLKKPIIIKNMIFSLIQSNNQLYDCENKPVSFTLELIH